MKQRVSQFLSTLLYNGYVKGFILGTIYQGNIKFLNCPGFNCYSCPGAVSACPIGIIQFFAAYGAYHITFYTLGFLGLVGSIGGRIICGWACPFGFMQDLLYKIKFPKCNIPAVIHYGKYLILIVLVFIIPFFTKEPWFCKLCPIGTLEAGIPHVFYNADLRQVVGRLFQIKIVILAGFLLWMIVSKRPFCRTVCPLGAIYSLFNKVSFFRIEVDKNRCIKCNKCYTSCPVSIKIYEDGGASLKCIRCLRCTDCPAEAVSYKLRLTL
jgi:ferredoxin-type protein NapH